MTCPVCKGTMTMSKVVIAANPKIANRLCKTHTRDLLRLLEAEKF